MGTDAARDSGVWAELWACWPHRELGASERRDLEHGIADAHARGEAAWPGVELAPERFVRAVAARIGSDAPPITALQRLHTSDIYLACACADGSRAAIDTLERHYLTALRPTIAKLGAGAATIDDILAKLEARLLAAPDGRGPIIEQYVGRGDLASWLKVVAVRETLATLRRDRHTPAENDEIEALLAPVDDPELEVMRERYRDEFRSAFEGTLARLETRERNVLRYHLLDRLSIDQIAAIHGVHRATAARWLARVRERLYDGTRRDLLARLGVTGAELDSILRLIRSQLDVSIGRHLQSED